MLQLSYNSNLLEAGCDEAGRGSLAGSVFAAAVILPPDFVCNELNDSKQMTLAARLRVRDVILARAVAWAVGEVSAEQIDRINILNASFEAMQRAVEQLAIEPQFLLIDGNRFRPRLPIPYRCEVKGDGRFANIAAASVLAKTFRDERMMQLDAEYPQYGWARNMGYPTAEHRLAISRYGLSPLHRQTFHNEAGQLSLFR
ncbi:MAG: ribonuclease HII [Tidjanibacter sp.]|nr:ribonuclease HII [Tidjanibacter sp.]